VDDSAIEAQFAKAAVPYLEKTQASKRVL